MIIPSIITLAVLSCLSSAHAYAVSDQGELANLINTQDVVEITASRLALARSADSDVTAYASRVLGNHTVANRVLVSLTQAETLTLSRTLDFEADLAKLETLEDSDFRAAYAKLMVDVHVWALNFLNQAARSDLALTPVGSFGMVITERVQSGLTGAEKLVSSSRF